MKLVTSIIIVLGLILVITGLSIVFAKQNPDYFRVFITKERVTGNVGGLTGADEICERAAHSAGLQGRWKAWLSDSRTSASDRLYHSPVRYALVNGETVAYNWRDLTTVKPNWDYLRHAIDVNQFGELMEVSNVMTGTNTSGGTFYGDPRLFCMDYHGCFNKAGFCHTAFGTSSVKDSDWTFTEQEGCSEKYHLYCFEQPAS